MSARPQTAKETFLAALDLPASEGSAFLSDACGNDEAMRREVEALLNAAERTDPLLDQERIAFALAMDSQQPALGEIATRNTKTSSHLFETGDIMKRTILTMLLSTFLAVMVGCEFKPPEPVKLDHQLKLPSPPK